MSAVGSILTNQGALDALQSISTTSAMNNTLENEMSTGLAISSPASNPAGYITAQGFTSQLNGLTQATSNANQAVSLLQTAQGAMQQQIGVVQQLNSIAVQAANGTQASTVNTAVAMSTMSTATSGGAGGSLTINVGGSTLGSVTASTYESAASLASQVNSMYGAKGVTASASNVVNLGQVTAASTTGGMMTLTLAASGSGKTVGTSYQATGSSTTSLMNSINKGTSDTGISATMNSAGSLILTQASADNIQVSGYASGADGASFSSVSAATGADAMSIQGSVQLAAGSQIAVSGTATGAAAGMVNTTSSFTSLAQINVSTVNGATSSNATGAQLNTQGGANQAIEVVNYALQSLNTSGGQLGAVQQGLTANINNLSTTSENVTSALGVVQDANLPQVANQLTQAQIQAQAGVAALKSSTTMQQSYLSLLP